MDDYEFRVSHFTFTAIVTCLLVFAVSVYCESDGLLIELGRSVWGVTCRLIFVTASVSTFLAVCATSLLPWVRVQNLNVILLSSYLQALPRPLPRSLPGTQLRARSRNDKLARRLLGVGPWSHAGVAAMVVFLLSFGTSTSIQVMLRTLHLLRVPITPRRRLCKEGWRIHKWFGGQVRVGGGGGCLREDHGQCQVGRWITDLFSPEIRQAMVNVESVCATLQRADVRMFMEVSESQRPCQLYQDFLPDRLRGSGEDKAILTLGQMADASWRTLAMLHDLRTEKATTIAFVAQAPLASVITFFVSLALGAAMRYGRIKQL